MISTRPIGVIAAMLLFGSSSVFATDTNGSIGPIVGDSTAPKIDSSHGLIKDSPKPTQKHSFRILSEKGPVYPRNAEKKGLEGYVDALLYVNRFGLVDSFRIVKSFPDTSFNRAVAEVIPTMRLTPADSSDTVSVRRFKRKWTFKNDSRRYRRFSLGAGILGDHEAGDMPVVVSYERLLKSGFSYSIDIGFQMVLDSRERHGNHFFEAFEFRRYLNYRSDGFYLAGNLWYGFDLDSKKNLSAGLFANGGYLFSGKSAGFSSLEFGVGPNAFNCLQRKTADFRPLLVKVGMKFGM